MGGMPYRCMFSIVGTSMLWVYSPHKDLFLLLFDHLFSIHFSRSFKMKFSVFAVSAGLLTGVLAAPAPSSHVVHEERSGGPSMWKRQSDALLDRSAVMPMSIGLKQRNLDRGHDLLMDVSHPSR